MELLQLQQRMPDLKAADVQLVVVVDQTATAEKTTFELGATAKDTLILIGSEDAYNAYQVAGIPANYLVSPQGRVVAVHAGYDENLVNTWLKLAR
jgi:hypothetical protein